ncbi:MAG: NADH-quinone oxidoreductase subunit NuoB [Proteobacteria bacterium]|nr:NADH-quinone oxidoreductase subunit NuoB [Pseudomonadota bacterium]
MLKTLRQIARVGLRDEPYPAPATDTPELLQAQIWQVLGRAACLRYVDAGSCNGCELEVQALGNPYYNLEGAGIHFVASPRHADVLLVSGAITHNMAGALRATYDAMPEPKRVVAIGDCAACGGIFGAGYATLGGLDKILPVDVTIHGCPPTPVALLRGILAAAARVAV